MSKKILLINVTDDESRNAILEDHKLQELLIEQRTKERIKGNIYKGVVVQVQPSFQAAFVDFGGNRNGFLSINDVNFSLFPPLNPENKNKNTIQNRLRVGMTVMVQVTREQTGNKGATLTTDISIPGRFMVFMPNSDQGGISKKIQDQEERTRLKSFLSAIEAQEHSVIIRTAGVGRSLQELKKDYTTLRRNWKDIEKDFHNQNNPGLIYEEDDIVIRTLRDYYTEDIKEIWVDNPETFQKALNFMKASMPRRQKDLKLFIGDRSLFSTYGIEQQVEQLTSREVKLKSGGSIVIDPTEALVAIDVNSGRATQEKNADNTALRTNLEAAEEVARQLRLRNLGGLVVIDFIDMEKEEYRREVEQKVVDCMAGDKAQHNVGTISQFGLLELSRQRISAGLSQTVQSVCPTCAGLGKVPSLLSSTNLILRSIRDTAAKGNLESIYAELPLEIANYLLNEKRNYITDLELEFGIKVIIRGEPSVLSADVSKLKAVYLKSQNNQLQQITQVKDEEDAENTRADNRKRRKRRGRHSNEKEVTSVEAETPKEEIAEELELQKEEPAKNKDTKKEAGKKVEKIADKKEQKEERIEETETPADVLAETVVKAETLEKVTEKTPEVESDIASILLTPADERSLHPGCLFGDVKQMSEEEIKEISKSLRNHVERKNENQKTPQIQSEFLWSTRIKEMDAEKAALAEKEAPVEEGILADKQEGVVAETVTPKEEPASEAISFMPEIQDETVSDEIIEEKTEIAETEIVAEQKIEEAQTDLVEKTEASEEKAEVLENVEEKAEASEATEEKAEALDIVEESLEATEEKAEALETVEEKTEVLEKVEEKTEVVETLEVEMEVLDIFVESELDEDVNPRTRRKTAAKKKAPAKKTTAKKKAEEKEADADVEEKPKKVTRGRKKATTKKETETVETADSKEEVEKKEVKKRAPRKKAAPKKTEAADAEQQENPTEETVEKKDEVKKAPRKRATKTTTRKTTAKKVKEAEKEVVVEEDSAKTE